MKKTIFPKIKKSPNYPKGGSRKLWTFSIICDIFSLIYAEKLRNHYENLEAEMKIPNKKVNENRP